MNYAAAPQTQLAASNGQPVAVVPQTQPYQDGFDFASMIDPVQLRAMVWRNRWLALLIVALAIIAALAFTATATRIYTAQGSLQIDRETAAVLESEERGGAAYNDAYTFLQTQVDIMQSRYLAERVAQRLNLANDPAFLASMGATREGLPPAGAERTRRLGNMVRSGLDVNLPRNSSIVRVEYASADPQVAAKLVNGYLDAFAQANLSRRFDSTAYARQFLQDQLADAQDQLEASERASLAYARRFNLIDTSQGSGDGVSGGSSLTTSNLVQLNTALNDAQQRRIRAEQRWRTASGSAPLSLPEVQSNAAVQQLQQQKALAEAQYSELRQRYTDAHPSVAPVRRRISALDTQISEIAGQARQSIRQEYQSAQREESALRQRVQNLRGATQEEQDRSVQYNILKRQADTNRQVYDSLLQRLREVSQEAQLVSNNVSLLDRAQVPQAPSSPRPALNLALGLLAGLLAAGIAIVLRERLDDQVRDPSTINERLGLPLLGTIPKAEKGSDIRSQLDSPRSALAESYQSLVSLLRLNLDLENGTVLLMTSARGAEGKTTSSFATAQNLAAGGIRTLLIDGDMRRPAMHKMLGVKRDKGLSNLLSGELSPDDVVVKGDFDFIPAGATPANPAMLLGSAALPNTLEKLRSLYQVVLIDGPPVLGLADSPIYASKADLALLVVEAQETSRSQARIALRRLEASEGRMLGVILTKFDHAASGYGSDYGYSYYSYGNDKKGRGRD